VLLLTQTGLVMGTATSLGGIIRPNVDGMEEIAAHLLAPMEFTLAERLDMIA